MSLLTINALAAATSVIIPVQAQYLSVKGLELLVSTILKVKRNLNPELELQGILITMLNNRLKHSKSIINDLKEVYGHHILIFETTIPHSVKAAENTSEGKSLHEYAQDCKVSLAYENFTQEVLANGLIKS